MTIPAGTIKRLHVNQHEIRANLKDDGDRPAMTVQTSKGPHRAHEVEIHGPSRLVQSAKPLSCGARVWVETTEAVTLHHRH